jgi:hypothetical protein
MRSQKPRNKYSILAISVYVTVAGFRDVNAINYNYIYRAGYITETGGMVKANCELQSQSGALWDGWYDLYIYANTGCVLSNSSASDSGPEDATTIGGNWSTFHAESAAYLAEYCAVEYTLSGHGTARYDNGNGYHAYPWDDQKTFSCS